MRKFSTCLITALALTCASTAAAASLSLTGSGTETDPYQIGTAADWNTLAEYMATNVDSLTGTYFQLTADIDFTGTTVKQLGYDRSSVFNGTLDGNGKTLSGFTATSDASCFGGLIITAGTASYIHDLTVSGTVAALYTYCGGFIGTMKGTLSNVSSSVTYSSATTSYDCGLVARAEGATISGCSYTGTLSGSGNYCTGIAASINNTTVTSCTFSGSITATGSYAAGIVGWGENYSVITGCTSSGSINSYIGGAGIAAVVEYCTISDCTNNTSITGTGKCQAGIAAWLFESTMDNCVNNADITAKGTLSGGLVGIVDTLAVVSNCKNYGAVTNSSTYTGGITGGIRMGTVTGCTNYGTVTSTGGAYVGGLVGQIVYTGLLKDCVNEGTVSGKSYASGGAGEISNDGYLENCTNKGAVSCNTYTGGVVGLAKNSTVTGAVNYGTITGNGVHTGGTIAFSYYTTFDSCYNYGVVTGGGTGAGGIAAMAYNSNGKNSINYGTVISAYTNAAGVVGTSTIGDVYENCGNRGTVTYTGSASLAYAGGCFGETVPATFIGCFNEGTVAASTSSTTGGIGGVIADLLWNIEGTATITGCYNTADLTGYNAVGGIIGCTTSVLCVNMDSCWNSGNITTTDTSADSYPAAGIASQYNYNSTYTNCYNTGTITAAGTRYAAGLFGYPITSCTASYPTSFSNCWNTGAVSSAAQGVGGIVGYLTEYATIDRCWNAGAITTSTNYAGGIAGYAADSISNSYNMGIITGADYIGGIAGYTAEGIADVYNAGSVAATETNIGNIVGDAAKDVAGAYYLTATDCGGSSYGTGLTYAGLGALELDGWINGDDYTYPYLHDNDYSKAYAAAVIPAEGDSYNSITGAFCVGAPDGVTWTASADEVSVTSNNATFTATYDGTLTMTATCGEASVSTELTCNVEIDGISSIDSNGRTVAAERFYTVDGQQVAEPCDGNKAVYIVVRTYDDGTTEAIKEAR